MINNIKLYFEWLFKPNCKATFKGYKFLKSTTKELPRITICNLESQYDEDIAVHLTFKSTHNDLPMQTDIRLNKDNLKSLIRQLKNV